MMTKRKGVRLNELLCNFVSPGGQEVLWQSRINPEGGLAIRKFIEIVAKLEEAG
jgi:hypothetical protein